MAEIIFPREEVGKSGDFYMSRRKKVSIINSQVGQIWGAWTGYIK